METKTESEQDHGELFAEFVRSQLTRGDTIRTAVLTSLADQANNQPIVFDDDRKN